MRLREAPARLAVDWSQIGVTRGLVLGLLYPWVLGALVSLAELRTGAAPESLLVYGIYGTPIGLLAGVVIGSVVAATASAIEGRTRRPRTRRSVATAAICSVATVVSVAMAATALVTRSPLDGGWLTAWMYLVLGPAALGLASIVAVRLPA
jgi:hypothetical protein